MTPELKAKELVGKFLKDYGEKNDDGTFTLCIVSIGRAKACAIIAVDEILELDVWDWPHNAEQGKLFWGAVKNHIQNL